MKTMDIVAALAGSLLVLSLCWFISAHIPPISRFLRYCGENSLDFMCVHSVEYMVIPWQEVYDYLGHTLPVAAGILLFKFTWIFTGMWVVRKLRQAMKRRGKDK